MITLTVLILLAAFIFFALCVVCIPILIVPAILIGLFFIVLFIAGSVLDAFVAVGILYIIYRIIRSIFK